MGFQHCFLLLLGRTGCCCTCGRICIVLNNCSFRVFAFPTIFGIREFRVDVSALARVSVTFFIPTFFLSLEVLYCAGAAVVVSTNPRSNCDCRRMRRVQQTSLVFGLQHGPACRYPLLGSDKQVIRMTIIGNAISASQKVFFSHVHVVANAKSSY